jgi:phosphate starvation-inducible PhoH-like protein
MIAIEGNQLTFGVGPAGTGKTYICTRIGAQLLKDKKIKRLIVTRPAVEAGGGLGFLPGTIQEKFAPYFAPFRAVLDEVFGPSQVDYLIKNGDIEIQPLEYIRGLTFDNCFVILDEAQNTTPGQMKLFLSRIGEYSNVVVNGDVSQQDIEGLSGLTDAMDRLEGLKSVEICEFTEDDIVRSGLCKEIVKRYRN